jgi:alpha-mannosidase
MVSIPQEGNIAGAFLNRYFFQMRIRRALLPSLCLATALLLVFARATEIPPPSPASPGSAAPLYMLTYDHGGLILWGTDHFRQELRRAMSWLDRYPNFKIGLDNEAYVYDYLAENDPALLAELRADLTKYRGRFGIGTCTYGQPLSQFINDESNLRQIGYAIKTDQQQLGYRPVIYLMSEHAMHSQIPQILTGFGFKGAIMRTHFMMYGYNPTFDVPIGWWVGVDGSRIPAVPTYPGEGGEFFKTTVDNWFLTRFPAANAQVSPADFRKTFQHIQPLLATRADDSSLRKEELVQQYPGTGDYRWILLDELLSIFPPPTAEMKTAPNDFTVRMPWGYCGNEIFNSARQAEVAVLTAERLATMELLCGGTANREADLEHAWKNLLVGQHHDVQICGLLADARRFFPSSLTASHNVSHASLNYVASQMKADGLAQVTVFNPLSWDRSEWIEADLTLPKASAQGIAVRHGDQIIPSAVLKSERSSAGLETRIAFRAAVPALGFASYSVVLSPESTPIPSAKISTDFAKLRIATPFFILQLDPQGGIASLVDAHTGNPLLTPGKRSGFFAGRINGVDCESKGTWILHAASGGRPWVTAREYGFIGGIPYTLEIQLSAESPRIDVQVKFHFEDERIGQVSDDLRDHESAFVHEAKLRFKLFPAVGDHALGVRDLPFTIAETANHYVEGNYLTALTDSTVGIAFFNRGTMGAVHETDGGFSMPLAYAMYYIWGTRMLSGDFNFEFSVEPFSGGWQQADLLRRALAYSFPFSFAAGEPGSGRLGDIVQPLTVSGSADVLVSAMYPENGRAYVRLMNYSGTEHEVSLGSVTSPSSYTFTFANLLGEGGQAATGPFPLHPWQFQTFLIGRSN